MPYPAAAPGLSMVQSGLPDLQGWLNSGWAASCAGCTYEPTCLLFLMSLPHLWPTMTSGETPHDEKSRITSCADACSVCGGGRCSRADLRGEGGCGVV